MMIYKKLIYSMNKMMNNKASGFHEMELKNEKQILLKFITLIDLS